MTFEIAPSTEPDLASAFDFLMRMLSVSSMSGSEADVAKVFAEEVAGLGFSVETDSYGSVLATARLGPGPVVLIDGHLDTVPFDAAEWSRDPLGEIDEEAVYGRGAVDMKGPLAAVTYAAAALRNTKFGTIVLSASVLEELAEGAALAQVVERFSPDVVLICEPSDNRLMLGQRGRVELVVDVHGVAAHSAYSEHGVNAVEQMADVVRALRSIETESDPDLGHSSMVITDLISSPHPSLSTVPDRCRATYDLRTVSDEADELLVGRIAAFASEALSAPTARVDVHPAVAHLRAYTGVLLEHPIVAPPWKLPLGHWAAEAAISGLRSVGRTESPGYYAFCTNGSMSAGVHRVPTLGFGPGAPEQAHKIDEHITVRQFEAGVHAYVALLSGVLQGDRRIQETH